MHPNHNIETSEETIYTSADDNCTDNTAIKEGCHTVTPRHTGPDELQEVFDFWAEKTGHPKAIFSPKRRQLLKARLKEGLTIQQLKSAVTGVITNPHNTGEKTGVPYLNFELIFRDVGQVEKYEGYNKKLQFVSKSNLCSDCKQESSMLIGRPSLCGDCHDEMIKKRG